MIKEVPYQFEQKAETLNQDSKALIEEVKQPVQISPKKRREAPFPPRGVMKGMKKVIKQELDKQAKISFEVVKPLLE